MSHSACQSEGTGTREREVVELQPFPSVKGQVGPEVVAEGSIWGPPATAAVDAERAEPILTDP